MLCNFYFTKRKKNDNIGLLRKQFTGASSYRMLCTGKHVYRNNAMNMQMIR